MAGQEPVDWQEGTGTNRAVWRQAATQPYSALLSLVEGLMGWLIITVDIGLSTFLGAVPYGFQHC